MQKARFILPKMAVGLLVIAASFSSCSKDDLPTPGTPQPAFNKLAVQFAAGGLHLSDVDSAVVVIRNSNNDINKWKTMSKSTNELSLQLDGLSAGNYTASIEVYEKKGADQTARQYALNKSFSMPLQQNIVLSAPKGSFTDIWFKRVVFSEGQNDAVAIVSMDPRDTYYGATFKAANWKRVIVKRYSVYQNALVAMKEISKNLNSTIGFSEYYAFTPYVQEMNGKEWTKGYISLYLERNDGLELAFDYEYVNQ